MMSDFIKIDGLEVFANHGFYDAEVSLGQKFVVSAKLFYDARLAGVSDDLDKTINYAEACKYICDVMCRNNYKLIERVAEVLARKLLLKYEMITDVEITIKKPWAPIGLPLDSVSVTIFRSWHESFLSIGSNMGDKRKYLDDAISFLRNNEDIKDIAVSEYIETEPYGEVEQDDFLNAAVKLKTMLTPYELLEVLHEAEQMAGRERKVHWGPRTLDMDILMYDDIVLGDKDLTIPHPDMVNRDFVLRPLCEIAPYAVHPIYRRTVKDMLLELNG